MRKIFLLFLLYITTVNFVYAQTTGSVQGLITTSDAKAAPFVTIYLKNTKHNVITDNEGKFSIKNIQPGRYELAATLIGYNATEQDITVTANAVTNIAIQLKTSERELKK